jgi:O-antigen/teichoic acid export membrane protein
MGDVGWMYREAMGLWWEARYVSLVSAIVNLGLNLLMVNDYGLFGVLLSTIVSIVFIGIPFNSGVLFSKYFKSRREYVKFLAKLVFYFLSMCVTAGITYLICSLVHGDGIAALAIKAVICCIVPNIILLVINFRNPDLKKACRFALGIVPARLVPYRVRRLLN